MFLFVFYFFGCFWAFECDTIAEKGMTHLTMDKTVLMLGERGLLGRLSAHLTVYPVHLAKSNSNHNSSINN